MTTAAGKQPDDVDARLASIIGSAPKLAPLRLQIPKLTAAQKEALLARLLSLEPKTPARPRIVAKPRRPVPAPTGRVGGLSDAAVDEELRRVVGTSATPAVVRLRDKLPELSAPQRRALLLRLLTLSTEELVGAPLSYAQQGLWFVDTLAPGTATHTIAAGVRAHGELDVPRLQRCLNAIIQRHEALRTNFIATEAGPMQVIAPTRDITIVERDFRTVPASEREAAVMEAAVGEALRPFDLGAGPLVRVHSFQTDDAERILLMTLHHIVGDEWSVGILLEELGALYAHGERANLPALPVQYADYAEWQLETLTPEAVEREVEYWRRKLAGAQLVLEVPPDRPRAKVRTTSGSTEKAILPRSSLDGMNRVVRGEQATLFMALFACFNLLLYQRTGRKDILVGTDFANRDRPETARLIGLFVNELILRTDLSGDPSFRDLLRQIRRRTIEAFGHAELPFQRLVEELRPPRDPSRTPIFQVVFDLLNVPMSLVLDGVTFSPMHLPLRPAKYDLTLFISNSQDELYVMLEYNTDLYSRETARRFLEDYGRLVAAAAESPDVPLSALLDDGAAAGAD